MKNSNRFATAVLAGAGLLFFGAATAATSSEAQQRYQQDRKACMSGASNQDRATCLQEAGAALREAKRDGLAGGSTGQLGANRMTRCAALPAADRSDCEKRMTQGSTSGSAQQGGILRELEQPVPAPAR